MPRTTLVRAAAVLAALALLPMVLYVLPQLAGGSASYVVLSGSMAPTFQAGDFIVDRAFAPGAALEVGDIVTYRNGPDRTAALVTHRVVALEGQPGQRLVSTQGDANSSPDAAPHPEGRIVGIYVMHVPLYGYVAALPAQPVGKLLFIVLPCAAVFALEIRKLFRRSLAQAEAKGRAAARPAAAGPTATAAAPAAPAPSQVLRRAVPAQVVARRPSAQVPGVRR